MQTGQIGQTARVKTILGCKAYSRSEEYGLAQAGILIEEQLP